MDKSRALGLGIVAGFVIICGVLMGVLTWRLTQETVDAVREGRGEGDYSSIKKVSGPVWLSGIVYVLPGLLCLIAALVQNKCVYVLSCILSLICSAIVGLVLFIFGMAFLMAIIALVAVREHCIMDDDVCKCKTGSDTYMEEYKETPFATCDYLMSITNLTIGLFVVLCIGLLFLISAFVLACIYACRSKSTAGAVYTPAQQPMLQG